MIRLMGGMMVVGGCLALGLRKAAWYHRRTETLHAILGVLSRMGKELCDRNEPMSDLLRRLERDAPGTVRPFLTECLQGLNNLENNSFSEIWRGAVQSAQFALTEEEKNLLAGLGGVLGRYGYEEQREELRRVMEEFTLCSRQAKEEQARLSKVWCVMGGAAGALVVLVLL